MPDHAFLPPLSSKPFPFGECCDIGHRGSPKSHSAAVKLCEELNSECSRGVRGEQSCPGGLLSSLLQIYVQWTQIRDPGFAMTTHKTGPRLMVGHLWGQVCGLDFLN